MKEKIFNNASGIATKSRGYSNFINISTIRQKIPAPILHIFGNMRFKFFRLAAYILLLDMAFVFAFPFLYMVITSMKNSKDLYDITINWIPRRIEIRNYILAFRFLSYLHYFKNSFILTVLPTIGHLISCSFIGYGFARYNFKYKNILFSLVIISLIIPVQTIIVPLYMTFTNFKWINTYLPIIVPTFFGYGLRGGLFIFIFRQFYLGLPTALEDAAKIDGCGFFRTYWNIVLPIAKSAFIVVVVLSIVWHWNDFYEPTIYVNLPKMYILPKQLYNIITMVNNPPEEQFFLDLGFEDPKNAVNNAVLMAGTFLVILPVLISFSFLQRQFMQGIERTGLVE